MSTRTSVTAALAMIRAGCNALPSEPVALAMAAGRVLAEPIDSPRNLPPFDNSAMDGFALRWREDLAAGSILAVMGEQAAGDGERQQSQGVCSIMTGASMPDGLDTVVPVEECAVLARDSAGRPLTVALHQPPRPGQHVRRSGQDVQRGERILDAGTLLCDESIMVLRGIGVGTVAAHRRPRLALACTGRELVDLDGAELGPGQIANTNGPYLAALFAEAGAEVVEQFTVPDEPEQLSALFCRWSDAGIELVVTTGAVSMGRYDFVPDVLQRLGANLQFHKLAMRPGKPLLYATLGSTQFFGLPGNPVSSAVGARFFVDAAIRRLTGRTDETAWQLPLAHETRKKAGFTLIQKAALQVGADGRLAVVLLQGQESFRIAPLLTATAWAVLPAEAEHLAAGELVSIHPLRPASRGLTVSDPSC